MTYLVVSWPFAWLPPAGAKPRPLLPDRNGAAYTPPELPVTIAASGVERQGDSCRQDVVAVEVDSESSPPSARRRSWRR